MKKHFIKLSHTICDDTLEIADRGSGERELWKDQNQGKKLNR